MCAGARSGSETSFDSRIRLDSGRENSFVVDEILVAGIVAPASESDQVLWSCEGSDLCRLVDIEDARSTTRLCRIILASHIAARGIDRSAVRRESSSSPAFSVVRKTSNGETCSLSSSKTGLDREVRRASQTVRERATGVDEIRVASFVAPIGGSCQFRRTCRCSRCRGSAQGRSGGR